MPTEPLTSSLFLTLPNYFPVITAADFQSLIDYLSSRIRMAVRVYLEGEAEREASSNSEFMANIRAELELCGGTVAIAIVKYEGLIRTPECYKKSMLVVLNNGTMFRDQWLAAIAGGGRHAPDGYLDRYVHSWWLSFPNELKPLTEFMHGYNIWKQQQLRPARAPSPLPPQTDSLAALSLNRLRAARMLSDHLENVISEQVKGRMANIQALEAKIAHVMSELKFVQGKRMEEMGKQQYKRSRQ